MSVTPEIKTKFSLDGVKAAAGEFGRLAQAGRQTADRIKKSVSNILAPMKRDIETARRDLRRLATAAATVGRTGFRTLQTTSTAAFRSIRTGALMAAASITAIGAAAAAASRSAAQELDKLAKDAKRTGVSTEDLSVLQFAAEQEGVDPAQVTKGIARIGAQFVEVRNRIREADEEYARLRRNVAEDAGKAIRGRDGAGLQAAFDAFESGASGSLSAVRDRMARATTQRQLEDLRAQEQAIIKSFGPLGETLFGLEKYGLNVESVAKGGAEGFIALGDAIKQVEDPAERLRHSIRLFGEDQGPMMLTLLMQGKKGLAEYRKEAERLGIVVDSDLAGMGEAFETSATNFKQSLRGLRLEIARALLPDLTATNERMANWVASNRKMVTTMFRQGLDALRNFTLDVFDLMTGRAGRELRTPWLEATRKQVNAARRLFSQLRSDIDAIMGREQAANFKWLNVLGDGLWTAIDLATDFWDILQGRDAKNFVWLNDLRDDVLRFYEEAKAWVMDFAASLKRAFDAFVDFVTWLRDKFLAPIASLFNTDPTTMLLFIGLAKITGLLSVGIGLVKVFGKLLAGLAIPAALSAGLAPLATTLAALTGTALPAGALGGAGTAAVAGGAAAGGGRLAGLLRGPAGRLGAIGVGGAALGYAAYEGFGFGAKHRQRVEDLNRIIDLANARLDQRREYESYAQLAHNPRDLQKYWAERNVKVSDDYVKFYEDRNGPQDSHWKRGMSATEWVQARDAAPTRVIKLQLTPGGPEFTGAFTPDEAGRLEREANALLRRSR